MIVVEYRGKEFKFKEKELRAGDILRRLNLKPTFAVVLRGDEILRENEVIKEGERVKVINAISGGKF